MNDFTTGKIAKPLIAFAAPMMIGNLLQQTYNIVDAMIVGRFINGDALAAVGVSSNIALFLISALIGLTTGSGIVIAQFFGAKQYDRLKATVSVSIIFLLGLSALFMVLGILFTPALLRLLNTGPEIFDDALVYIRILLAGMIFPVFMNMYSAYLRALGDSRRPLYFLFFSVVLNAILTPTAIIVLGWGVTGAAVSTLISQFAAALLCFLYAHFKVPLLKVEKLKFDFGLFRIILKYGLPAALQMSIVSLAQLLIVRLINSFGSAAMAGITAVSRIDSLATMPLYSLAMAMSTFVAQNMGAGLEDRAKKGFKSATIYMLAFSVAISALLMALAPQLVSLFLDQGDANSEEIIRVGQMYMNIMVVFYFLFAIFSAINGFFRGAGDAVIAMAFPIVSLAFRTGSAYALIELAGMGPEALAWSIPIGWGVCCIGCWIYYKKRLWAGKVAA